MKTIYIIVEGPTEEEYINNCLAPYLAIHGIVNTIPILLETSPGFYGGDVTFARYLLNATNLLVSDPNAIVTSLIDFYQLRKDFPGYAESLAIPNIINRIEHLENELSQTIANQNYIPYLQLHEFEAILFVDNVGFNYIPSIRPNNRANINAIIAAYPNPELINNGAATAPSKRLQTLIPKYKKPFHGPIIALENGITPVLTKCPRFNVWVQTLIAQAS